MFLEGYKQKKCTKFFVFFFLAFVSGHLFYVIIVFNYFFNAK